MCQTSAWDVAGSPAGLCHSCELSTHYLLALLPRCSHQASRLSQRLRESLGASCDHCHKNRVPWTGCHCCLLSVKGASYVLGPLVSLNGDSIKLCLPHRRDVLLVADLQCTCVWWGKGRPAESREVTGQSPAAFRCPIMGLPPSSFPSCEPVGPTAVSASGAGHSSTIRRRSQPPSSPASEPGVLPMRGQGNPSRAVPVTWTPL